MSHGGEGKGQNKGGESSWRWLLHCGGILTQSI